MTTLLRNFNFSLVLFAVIATTAFVVTKYTYPSTLSMILCFIALCSLLHIAFAAYWTFKKTE